MPRAYDRHVPQPGEAALGLRERKKQRTRATLVDVAARLCAEQGYERTTVDQIAAGADVSPRTFSRYFPNKEAVIGALMEDIAGQVADALTRQPHDITEHEALVRAHTEVLRAAEHGQPDERAFDRMRGFLSIVNGSPMLSLATFTFREDGSTHAVGEAIAKRMGLLVTDPAVRVVFDTWAVLMASALGRPGSDAADPHAVSDRIEETFAIFTRLWKPWRPSADEAYRQPPSGGAQR
jgi:AcrR family transcriptional regulator